tara:strand:- start:405 stop:635 length:231 start_codon:yes stop_codon:yes gene_type:complete
MIGANRMYQVTIKVDNRDKNPLVELFNSEWEASEFCSMEFTRRMDYMVQHCPYYITENDYTVMEDHEWKLYNIERV